MRRIIPILVALLLLSGCAKQSAEKTYRQITMEEAITMMEEEKIVNHVTGARPKAQILAML